MKILFLLMSLLSTSAFALIETGQPIRAEDLKGPKIQETSFGSTAQTGGRSYTTESSQENLFPVTIGKYYEIKIQADLITNGTATSDYCQMYARNQDSSNTSNNKEMVKLRAEAQNGKRLGFGSSRIVKMDYDEVSVITAGRNCDIQNGFMQIIGPLNIDDTP